MVQRLAELRMVSYVAQRHKRAWPIPNVYQIHLTCHFGLHTRRCYHSPGAPRVWSGSRRRFASRSVLVRFTAVTRFWLPHSPVFLSCRSGFLGVFGLLWGFSGCHSSSGCTSWTSTCCGSASWHLHVAHINTSHALWKRINSRRTSCALEQTNIQRLTTTKNR